MGINLKPEGTSLYKNLMDLTLVILEGTHKKSYGFEIKGFKESIFSKEECDFAKKHCLTDEEMVQILFQLGYSKSEKALQRNYQQIPYNYFIPRQLGSIYESFLEYQLDVAKEPMVYRKKGKYKQWEKLTAAIEKKLKGFEPIIKKNQLFFTPDNFERKATGSYYTPDYIVQYIVKETIGPLCEGKSSQEILDLKVCDPAMGSGHFLNEALNFITKKYLDALELEKPSEEIPTKAEAKRIVLDKCIFGVDINPRAVKLAKMSLWLESAHPGKKLERLDDQLFLGDSLNNSGFHKKIRGYINVVIGNPPYVANKDYIINSKGQSDLYIEFLNLISLDNLHKNFYFGMIVPDTVLLRDNAKDFRRKLIQNKYSLKKAIHCKGVFEGVNVSNAILIITSTERPSAPSFYRISSSNKESFNSINNRSAGSFFLDVKTVTEDKTNRFAYLLNGCGIEKLIKCEHFVLSDFFIDRRGEEISKKDICQSGKYKILIGGESITPYSLRLDKSGYVKEVRKAMSYYTSPKIVLQKSAPKFVAAIDENNLIVPQSIYILHEKRSSPIDLYFIVGYLNSELVNDYLRKRVTGYKFVMPHYEQKDLKNIPLPKFDFSKEQFEVRREKTKNNKSLIKNSLLDVCVGISIAAENKDSKTVNSIMHDLIKRCP